MRLLNLFEATREFEHKAIDPALMTLREYLAIINKENKTHPSDAYDMSIEDMNRFKSVDDYPILINTITRHNRVFEVRKSIIDLRQGRYVKTDEDGFIIRGEDGDALYMSPEEVEAYIPEEKRYDINYAIIDKETGKIVSYTADEWGTLLIATAREYRNFGFGTMLVKLVRGDNPTRPSGGFTNAGLNNLIRVWSKMVKEYAASGFYSHLVKTGKMTAKRAKEIINDADKTKKYPERDYHFNDPSKWLLLTDGSSYAILYDRRFLDLDDPDSEDDYWINKHIIAMAELGSSMSILDIGKLYGPEKLQAFLIAALMSMELGDKFDLNEYEVGLLKKFGYNVHNDNGYFITKELVPWKDFAKLEHHYRRAKDPYDEFRDRILERAESLADKTK